MQEDAPIDDAPQEGRDIREVSAAKLGKLIEWAEADEVDMPRADDFASERNSSHGGEDGSDTPRPPATP